MVSKRIYGQLFTTTDRFQSLREDENLNPILEENTRTFRLTKQNKKFILYEIRRKKKPLRIKTFKPKKSERLNTYVSRIKKGDIILKSKNVEWGRGKNGRWESIQTNYYTRYKQKVNAEDGSDMLANIQKVGLVRVFDERREIVDLFIGYSKGINRRQPTKKMFENADDEVIAMAKGKFITRYGLARSSSDLKAVILKSKWQQWRVYPRR